MVGAFLVEPGVLARQSKSRTVKQKKKIIKTIAFFGVFKYTKCNRVARGLFDIGDQAETCAQLFYVKEKFYGLKVQMNFRKLKDVKTI